MSSSDDIYLDDDAWSSELSEYQSHTSEITEDRLELEFRAASPCRSVVSEASSQTPSTESLTNVVCQNGSSMFFKPFNVAASFTPEEIADFIREEIRVDRRYTERARVKYQRYLARKKALAESEKPASS